MGTHWLFDFAGCDRAVIDDEAAVRRALVEAAGIAGATIVAEVFHRFSPQGVTGVLVLAESHLAAHSWPELGSVAVDLFSCNPELRARDVAAFLRAAFQAESVTLRQYGRGE